MPRSDRSRPVLGFWRILLLFVAGVLGIAAVCLVVFGNSQRQLQFGVLLGLWAFLIGAFLGFGSRRGQADQAAAVAEAERRSAQLHEAQLQVSQLQYAQLEAAQEVRSKQEVELRKFGEMQLSREAAARREADLNLEISLRREIERMMTEQLGALRDEVAALRAEVVDKLGGQLRLERIETTRVIGSDLEALQHEIRRLAGSKESLAQAPAAVSAPLSQLPRRPAEPSRAGQPAGHDIVDAEVIEPEVRRSGPIPESASAEAEPVRVAKVQAEAIRAASAQAEAVRAASVHVEAEPVRGAAAQAEAKAAPVEPVVMSKPATGRQVPEPSPAKPGWSAPTVVAANPPVSDQAESTSAEEAEPVAAEKVEPTSAEKVEPVAAEASEPSAGGVVPPLYRQSEQVAAFTADFDPFAGLPRLSPLPDDIELIQDSEPEPEPVDEESAGRRRAPDAGAQRYHGRRRADGEPEEVETTAGRRRADGESGGRRRAPDDAPDDLMARLTDR